MVEAYARIAYSCPRHREYSLQDSEPPLAEAAAQMIKDLGSTTAEALVDFVKDEKARGLNLL